MAKVSNGTEKLPKISIGQVGCTNVSDDRQTTDGPAEFTFAKKMQFIHTANGDGSKTAKNHKKAMLTALT